MALPSAEKLRAFLEDDRNRIEGLRPRKRPPRKARFVKGGFPTRSPWQLSLLNH